MNYLCHGAESRLSGLQGSLQKTVFFSAELCEAKDHYSLGKLETILAKTEQLTLDKPSYLGLNHHQSELLFQVISDAARNTASS